LNPDSGPTLLDRIHELPQYPPDHSFGEDIDAVHELLLDDRLPHDRKKAALLRWLETHQPCLFGRLAARGARGAKGAKGLTIDVFWIDEGDLRQGEGHLREQVSQARRGWKDRAERGLTSALLLMYNSRSLAYAKPSTQFAAVSRQLVSIYLDEVGEVSSNVVYTEAAPLRMNSGDIQLFKCSMQLFHSGAHLMRHHDRRVPGGVALSLNAPGHLTWSLAQRGPMTLNEAADFVKRNAVLTIGNGGIGHPAKLASSWHGSSPGGPTCSRPATGDTPSRFSAAYQIDVPIPFEVVTDDEPRLLGHRMEDVWPSLHLDYLNATDVPRTHHDYGWFVGMSVDDCAKYFNPWLPVVAVNHPDFNY
jgi:hypothetical protein